MQTAEEKLLSLQRATVLNAAVFDTLSGPAASAADAVNDFTRARLRETGFLRRLLRTVPVRSREEWLATGVDPAHVIDDVRRVVADDGVHEQVGVDTVWNFADTLEELLASRRRRLAYLASLDARTASRDAWYSARREARGRAKRAPSRMWDRERREEFAYSLACELAAMIAAAAGSS